MENKKYKKTLVLVTTLLFIGLVFLPSTTNATKISNAENLVINVQTSDDTTIITYKMNNFNEIPVEINGKLYSRLTMDDETNILLKGMPDIPNICRSIIIPDTAKMDVRVISSTYVQYNDVYVAPSKGNLLRTVNPDDVPFEFSDIYKIDGFYPGKIAELSQPYIIRDFRGQVVKVYPIQYNPVEKTMRFYKDITVEIFPVGSDTNNIINRNQLPLKVDANFNEIYSNHFINYDQLGRYTPVSEQGNMLVITYDSFWDAMVPFVQWKNMKGVPTEMVNVSEIGDANAIKTEISNRYNANGLTFVLLVGDAAQVPTFMAGGYTASDPSYSYIVGNDHYADLFVGRFSAENLGQVQTQVERSLEYEKLPQIGAEWYKKGVGIGSAQGPGDDNEMDYQHVRNIRTLLMNFTYTTVDELYDGSQGGEDASGNPTPTTVATSVNGGRSIINYCGHGSPTSWGTSGFSNSDISALTNDNMLPFIVSVACNNGEFNDYTCFAEAWLRATHNGEPTGAIGAYMSTISQGWDPPMEAEDEFDNILVGLYPENIRVTYGALCFEGAMSMIDKYGSEGITEADAWTVFGDPSLQIRTDTPAEMTVTHASQIEQGATTFDVTVSGLEGALCAISQGYNLVGYAYTDASGQAAIDITQPFTSEQPLDLVVTSFNKAPYMAQILVITNNPPNKPATPSGPPKVKTGVAYLYTTQTTDPDGDSVYYMWSWGDGNFSDWVGPFNSGASATATHSWTEKNTYEIKVKSKDINGDESAWSDPMSVIVPRNRMIQGTFLQKILERFPNAFPLLKYIFNL